MAIFVGMTVGVLHSQARGENWPGWRGPRGDGISLETGVPVEWSPTKNIAWKTKIPGRGHSSPILWNDAVFVTSALPGTTQHGGVQQRMLYRVDRKTGRIVWERSVLVAPEESIHPLNSYASSTPATDGEKVFVTFLDGTQMYVAAYDFEGNKLWEKRPGPFASKHGFCTCPVLYRDGVILNGDHDGDAYLVMLRKSDGEILWKTERPNRTRSYCTPILVRENGRDQLMLNGSFCTAGFDCETGKQIWVCDGPSEQMVATLVIGHGLIFSLGGYPERHLLAIRRGGTGDITQSHIAWRTHKSIPYVPSPLLYGDFLHVIADEGIYTCFAPTTGDVHYRERVAKHVSSSLVGAENRIYVTDDTGTTSVLENGSAFKVVAKNSVGEEVFSTPAISQGNVFVRGVDHLFCIGSTPR